MRYPGAPNDTGTMHPIIEAVMQSDHEHMTVAVGMLAEVSDMTRAVVREATSAIAKDQVESLTLEDAPAWDRITDLAVLGLMVERHQFYPTSEELAELAMEPCENFTKGHTCLDEGSGKLPNATYLADRYCWPCRLRHAMGGSLVVAQGR